ncbi:hypothetical protein [Sedimentimonas flavescens]|uniref:hypothetical protein n=1 Tax=Sedimentimonas flavescens TaxID=2851012 RepID=UPI001C4A2CA5|nr:hypothetical protein [Sedimentimonas flavescens]MBW0159153.1 hypothetical protein [Sedimentimonas flavescens]
MPHGRLGGVEIAGDDGVAQRMVRRVQGLVNNRSLVVAQSRATRQFKAIRTLAAEL